MCVNYCRAGEARSDTEWSRFGDANAAGDGCLNEGTAGGFAVIGVRPGNKFTSAPESRMRAECLAPNTSAKHSQIVT